MKNKSNITESTIETTAKNLKALKATNAISKGDVVKIIDDKSQSTIPISVTEDEEQYPKFDIKYLSNVKDSKTGEISKPFTIGNKKYQMVRGVKPNKEIVLGVHCLNEKGEEVIYPLDYFEKNIVGKDKEISEVKTNSKNEVNHLNLKDLKDFKHFFVNIKTGEVTKKFKTFKEIVKSGEKLGKDEDYMTAKDLKRFRFGKYFKDDIKEDEATDIATSQDNTNVSKLESDVEKLANLIKDKFSNYLSKLDKPIEQAAFIEAISTKIGLPLNKLVNVLTTYKNAYTESKIITKNQLIETVLKDKTS